MLKQITLVTIIFATVLIGLGYIVQNIIPGLLLTLAVGCGWGLVYYWKGWVRLNSPLAFIMFILAMAPVWSGRGFFWMFLGFVLTLVAWDLAQFDNHLTAMEKVVHQEKMIQAHLKRLFMLAGAGLLAGFVAVNIRFQLSFALALLLGLVIILALNRAVITMRE